MSKSEILPKQFAHNAQKAFMSSCMCSLSLLRPFQMLTDENDESILKSATGLSGGMFSKGSTCGVVFSGALSLALLKNNPSTEWTVEEEEHLMNLVKDYINWFREKYGTTYCRERCQKDLWTRKGVLGIFLPRTLKKELAHVRGSAKYLFPFKDQEYISNNQGTGEIYNKRRHCAQLVLKKIREATGIGNFQLEKLSIVLDGGVGLHGGACGAIAGGVMGLSLKFGKNVYQASIISNLKDYIQSPRRFSQQQSLDDFFSVGGKFINAIFEEAGSYECRDICKTHFDTFSDFHRFINSDLSQKCLELIDFAAEKTIELIMQADLNLAKK